MDDRQRTLLMRGMGIFAALLLVTLTIGTFADFEIAQAIYNPDNPAVIFVSTLGLIPMAYPACLLLGVLTQRSLACDKTSLIRIAGAVLCTVLAILFGALITAALLSVLEGFGGLVGSELPKDVRMGIGAVAGAVLCAAGFKAGKANNAKDLARSVIIVVVVLAASFAAVELVKLFMSRPRPRLLFAGYDGIGFCPWYSPFSGAEGFIGTYGIEKDAFKSFPSGHSLQAAALLASFYGLSLVYPGLRSKLGIVLAIEIVFALCVMACRMILGAHFLSDVSVGALVSVASFFVIMAIDKRKAGDDRVLPEEGTLSSGESDSRKIEEGEERR